MQPVTEAVPEAEIDRGGASAAPGTRPATAAWRRWSARATQPHILFPIITLIVLAAIWATTLNLIQDRRAAAERTAAVASHDLADTYEAQVVRALREIDQTLKVVKYAYELRSREVVLQELRSRALLPPELLFTVSIADRNGDIVASTHPFGSSNVAAEDYFKQQREADTLAVGRSRRTPGSGDWKMQFSRRLNAFDGTFSGIAIVTVDSAYFVSGYEVSNLGEHGVLGLLGTDGIFRARRSGEVVSADDSADFASVVPAGDKSDTEARLTTNAWDGVLRYTSARQLYDFPLAVIVGLSAEEQLAAAREETRAYLWRASAGSVLLILVMSFLGRLSFQLAQSRRRVVDEEAAHASRVEYLAYHDDLTTLPNRSLFSRILSQSITFARRYDRRLAVLFLDLDRFKHIHDSLGHDAGDQLLRELAVRLKACLRGSDTVARLGGDEFVILLPELGGDEKNVADVAQKILSTVARPFTLLGQEFRITGSIGISLYPKDGLDEQTLTKNADIAMYQAKEDGKNNFRLYSEKLNANPLERLTLEASLRRALEGGEFELHYQAKREIRDGRITGMEALLRWQHPDLGTVAPMQFIPFAEESGLIVAIGKWAIRAACEQNVAWQRRGLPHLPVAVNLGARQFFHQDLLTDLVAILAETGMEPGLLELEIHESLLLRDVGVALRILAGINSVGVRIAIDDFGIGYSSLANVHQFPIDTIKIDRSFTRDMASLTKGKALAGAIIALGRALSLTVVAQGVETKEQADFLRENDCDELQGFYLDHPVPAEEIAALLRSQEDVAGGDFRIADVV